MNLFLAIFHMNYTYKFWMICREIFVRLWGIDVSYNIICDVNVMRDLFEVYYLLSIADSIISKTIYLIGQNFGGQSCRKSDCLPKILSAEKFCTPKVLSAEIFCPLKSKTCQISTNLMLKHIFLVNCMGK